MYDSRYLVGVGGWLAFFVIVIAIFQPLGTFASLYGNLYSDPTVATFYGPKWGALQILEWTLALLSTGIGWFMAYRLLKVEVWQTVRIVIAGIWVLAFGTQIVETAGVALIAGLPPGGLFEGMAAELFRAFIFGAVWTSYFLRSERVANTYSRTPDEGDMIEVFE